GATTTTATPGAKSAIPEAWGGWQIGPSWDRSARARKQNRPAGRSAGEVALADRHTGVAQQVVRRRHVEVEIWHRISVEVGQGRHLHVLAADLERDQLVLQPIELRRGDCLGEIEPFLQAGLDLLEGLLVVG